MWDSPCSLGREVCSSAGSEVTGVGGLGLEEDMVLCTFADRVLRCIAVMDTSGLACGLEASFSWAWGLTGGVGTSPVGAAAGKEDFDCWPAKGFVNEVGTLGVPHPTVMRYRVPMTRSRAINLL